MPIVLPAGGWIGCRLERGTRGGAALREGTFGFVRSQRRCPGGTQVAGPDVLGGCQCGSQQFGNYHHRM